MNEEFSSNLAIKISNFIAFKRALGFKYKNGAVYLRSLDQYCQCNDNPFSLTKAVVIGWIAQQEAKYDYPGRAWLSPIREFGRYLQSIGDSDAYILDRTFCTKSYRPQNWLLSESEIEVFLRLAISRS